MRGGDKIFALAPTVSLELGQRRACSHPAVANGVLQEQDRRCGTVGRNVEIKISGGIQTVFPARICRFTSKSELLEPLLVLRISEQCFMSFLKLCLLTDRCRVLEY